MRRALRLATLLSVVFATVVAAPAWSQDSAPAAVQGAKSAEFDKIFTEWKALLEELRNLREEYRAADRSRKGEISKRYTELVAKGETMEPKVVDAAVAAFDEAPQANEEVTNFLFGLAGWEFQRDNYEQALRLSKTLLEKGVDRKELYGWAGSSAFCVGELDLAEEYLTKAKELDSLGEHGAQHLDTLPYYREAWPKELEIRKAEAAANDLPRVLLKTNEGDIVVELFENEAPNSVANFISLVEKGFYNGLTFHRVLAAFMAQGGCPLGTGTGGPGYEIPCECYKPDRRLHFRGTLSMAHAGRDTGGSQFFLTFVPTTHLDGKHTAFGRVIEGMEVLAKIERRDPEDPNSPDPDKILEAKVLRKRDHKYEPKKTGE